MDTTSSKNRPLSPTAFQLPRLARHSRVIKPEPDPWADEEFEARNVRLRLGPNVIRELVARSNAGEHTPVLAKEHEISTTGPRSLLREEGVNILRQSIAAEDSDRAVKLYEVGIKMRDVVKELGY